MSQVQEFPEVIAHALYSGSRGLNLSSASTVNDHSRVWWLPVGPGYKKVKLVENNIRGNLSSGYDANQSTNLKVDIAAARVRKHYGVGRF